MAAPQRPPSGSQVPPADEPASPRNISPQSIVRRTSTFSPGSEPAGLFRTRTVSFQSTDARTLMRRSFGENGESSGDENTPIVSRERGNAGNYDTQGDTRPDALARQRSRNSQTSNRDSIKQDRRKPCNSGSQGGLLQGNNDTDEDDDDEHSDDKPETRWGRFVRHLERYGSVELENKGSVARDHLALERTFLAWLRTSLSFASIGVAVTQLFRLNTAYSDGWGEKIGKIKLSHVGKPIGATFLAVGIVTLFIGFHRYFESQHYVIRGKFPASRGSIVIVAVMSAALIIASFVVVLTTAPHVTGT